MLDFGLLVCFGLFFMACLIWQAPDYCRAADTYKL